MALKEKIPCPRCDAKGIIPRYYYNRKGLCFLCYGEKYIYVRVPEGQDRDKFVAALQQKEKAHLDAHPPKVAMPDKIKNKAYDVAKEKAAHGKGGGKEDAEKAPETASGDAKAEPKYAVGDSVTVTIPASRKNLEIKNVGATITGISGDRVKLAFNTGDARADAEIRSRPGFPISVITSKEKVIDRSQIKRKTGITRDSDLNDVTNADLSNVSTEDLQILQQRIVDTKENTPARISQAAQVINAIFERTDYKVNAWDKKNLAKKVEGNTYSQLKRKITFLDKELRDAEPGTRRHERAKDLKNQVEGMMDRIAAEYPEIKRTQMALPLLGGATVGQKFQILNKGDQVKVKLNGLANSNEIVTAKVAGISQTKGQLRFDFDDDNLKNLNDLWLDPSYLNTEDAAAETPEEVGNLIKGDQIYHDGEWLTIDKAVGHTGFDRETKGRTIITFTDGTEAMKMPKTKVRTRKIKGPETAVKKVEVEKEAARVINDKVMADAEKMAAELDGDELEETIVYGVNSLAGMPAGPQSEILEYKLSVLVKKMNKTQAGFKKMPNLPKASDFDGSAAEAFKRGLSMNKADAQAERDKLKKEALTLGTKLREYQRGTGFPEEVKGSLKQRQQLMEDTEKRRDALNDELTGLEAAAKVTGMRRIMTGEDGPPKAAAEPAAPEVRPNQLVSTVGPYQVTTRQHTRTKQILYAIEPVNRVDMDEFRKMLQDLKENVGGFYDRKVFKRHLTAEDPTEALEKWLKLKAKRPGKE